MYPIHKKNNFLGPRHVVRGVRKLFKVTADNFLLFGPSERVGCQELGPGPSFKIHFQKHKYEISSDFIPFSDLVFYTPVYHDPQKAKIIKCQATGPPSLGLLPDCKPQGRNIGFFLTRHALYYKSMHHIIQIPSPAHIWNAKFVGL